MSPGNSCTPKSESEWAAFVGRSVATPAGNCVGSGCSSQGLTDVGATSASGHQCSVSCPVDGGDFSVLVVYPSTQTGCAVDIPDSYVGLFYKCALPEPGYTVDADGTVQDRQVISALLPPCLQSPSRGHPLPQRPHAFTSLSCVHSRRVPEGYVHRGRGRRAWSVHVQR